MADKLDPHHLVALMNLVFWKKKDGSARSLDTTLINPEHGTTNRRATSIRTFPILDVIASISVFEEKSQVVAVALQLNSREREIRLTIAENREVKPCVVAHLVSVWGKLQALSNEFGAEGGLDENEQGSPDIPEDVALPLRANIFREIYLFSLKKQMKRVNKWWSGLLALVVELDKRRGNALQGVESDLFDVVAGMYPIIQLVEKHLKNPERGLLDSEWQTIHDLSMWASGKAALVLDGGNFRCEKIAEELNDSPPSKHKDDFRLRRALEKLTSLTRHIECLISFANSPRLRPALKYHMSISTVPGQTRIVELPRSLRQWQAVLEVAAAKKLSWQKGYARKLAKHFVHDTYVCPCHCECALIQYLTARHNDSWDSVPAFGYVGVSKLSCSACRIWLEAFNELGQRNFYVRGSHGKWYWPWGMPWTEEVSLRGVIAGESSGEVVLEKFLVEDESLGGEVMAGESSGEYAPEKSLVEDESLGDVMAGESSEENAPRGSLGETLARKISREYINHLKEQQLYRSDSDSTDASFSGGKRHLSNARMESLRSGLEAVKQTLRGTMAQH